MIDSAGGAGERLLTLFDMVNGTASVPGVGADFTDGVPSAAADMIVQGPAAIGADLEDMGSMLGDMIGAPSLAADGDPRVLSVAADVGPPAVVAADGRFAPSIASDGPDLLSVAADGPVQVSVAADSPTDRA